MPTNYDKIAFVYDLLSRMVFGSHIVKSQTHMLPYVPAGSKILIVGGGTGWILEKLSERYSHGLAIDYVESSGRMAALSQKRNYRENTVNFFCQPIENFETDEQYDVIITPFIFDNFQAGKAGLVFAKLDGHLRHKGVWLYADFVNDKRENPLWQKFLLKVMYLFFRITCGIETQQLISVDHYFIKCYIKEFEAYQYFKFIRSDVYRKR